MVVSSQNEADTRFFHLLQPIRDLTKNWDVDIASQLEEYLDEIEKIQISFDGGISKMNFAEAALLIQGSACVYSKKVEYLYSLVYQVLDILVSKRKMQKAQSGEGEEDTTTVNRKNDDEFLILDDVKQHTKIVVKATEDGKDLVTLVIPQIPSCLFGRDDADKGDNPLLSSSGEILGNRNDYKINTSRIHTKGAMTLDLSHLSLVEISMTFKPCSTPYPQGSKPGEEGGGGDAEQPAVDEGIQDNDVSMNEDNDVGFDALENISLAEHVEEKVDRQLRRPEKRNIFLLPPTLPKFACDPWKAIDPHLSEGLSEKPLKKGKTFKLPDTLLTDANRKRKRHKEVTAKVKLEPLSDFCTKAFYSCASKYPTNKLKAPAFPEFEHLYWVEFKRRQAKFRKDKKIAIEKSQFLQLYDEDEDLGNEQHPMPDEGGDDDDDVGPLDDFQMGDLDPLLRANELPADVSVENNVPDASIVNSYEDLVRRHVEGFLASAEQYAQVTELSKRVAEWEHRIVPALKDEESHEIFDIHKYGTKVIDKFAEDDSTPELPFRKVVAYVPAGEVCRLLLATLQLANNYNLQIGRSGVLEEAVDTMTIKLLSRKRHFEEVAGYQAPSLKHK